MSLINEFFQIKSEPIIADRSSLQQCGTCPHQRNLCEKHNIQPLNKCVQVGSEIHRIVEETLKPVVEEMACHETLSPPELAEAIVDALPMSRPDIQPEVMNAARWLADMICHTPIHKIIGIEKQIDYELFPGTQSRGPFMITTCIDLLMSGRESLIVYDWKTGYKKRSNQEAKDDFQTCVIAFILWKLYPDLKTIHFFYKSTYWGSSHDAYCRLERNEELPQLPHLTLEMQFQARIILASQLWMNKSDEAWPEPKKCSQCHAIHYCKYADPTAKEMTDDPQKFVDQMVVLEEKLKSMKGYAKDYIKEHITMKGTASEFTFKPPKSKFCPKIYALEENDENESE
jgi:hypothetical protein